MQKSKINITKSVRPAKNGQVKQTAGAYAPGGDAGYKITNLDSRFNDISLILEDKEESRHTNTHHNQSVLSYAPSDSANTTLAHLQPAQRKDSARSTSMRNSQSQNSSKSEL